MKVSVIGCGDAFGSGGRLQTCFHVLSGNQEALIDCGATAVLGCQRLGIDLNRVSAVFISHLHGDHFAGLVWILIHAAHVAKRQSPLLVTGPRGLAQRVHAAAEALFPGSMQAARTFDLSFVEYPDWRSLSAGAFSIEAREVRHPSGAPSYGLRVEAAGKVLAFSGDTEWVPNLLELSAGADLFITECYAVRGPARYHLDWDTIRGRLDEISAARVLLTHMNMEMLARSAEITHPRVMVAHDGLVLDL